MATLLRADGGQQEVQPANGTDFQADELHELVGGYFELHRVGTLFWLVLDEDGKGKGLAFNSIATHLLGKWPDDYVVGDALLCRIEEVQ